MESEVNLGDVCAHLGLITDRINKRELLNLYRKSVKRYVWDIRGITIPLQRIDCSKSPETNYVSWMEELSENVNVPMDHLRAFSIFAPMWKHYVKFAVAQYSPQLDDIAYEEVDRLIPLQQTDVLTTLIIRVIVGSTIGTPDIVRLAHYLIGGLEDLNIRVSRTLAEMRQTTLMDSKFDNYSIQHVNNQDSVHHSALDYIYLKRDRLGRYYFTKFSKMAYTRLQELIEVYHKVEEAGYFRLFV